MNTLIGKSTSKVVFVTPAPRYKALNGSSLDKNCANFEVEVEFIEGRQATLSAEMKQLKWQNGNGATILTISGSATPTMLRDLSAELKKLATRIEKQKKILEKMKL